MTRAATISRLRVAHEGAEARRQAETDRAAADFDRGRSDGYRWAAEIAPDLDAMAAVAGMDRLKVRLAMLWRVGRRDPIRDAAGAVGVLTDDRAQLAGEYVEGFYVGVRQLRDEVTPLVVATTAVTDQ